MFRAVVARWRRRGASSANRSIRVRWLATSRASLSREMSVSSLASVSRIRCWTPGCTS